MATAPAFTATINNGSVLLAGAETNLQVPTTTGIVLTAGATGTQIYEVVVEATTTTLVATTVAGLIYLFLFDGTTYHLFDTIGVTAVTPSATVAPYRARSVYTNLIVKTGWSLRASQSIAGNASILKVSAFGGDM
jgi:hypothetical protein